MSSYYDDEEDLDIHVRHRGHSPQPVRYVQSPPRVRSYYGAPTGPSYLVPEQHTTVVARARSRDRSHSRDRRGSPPVAPPPPPAPANPVIINNRIYTEHSEDDESDTSSHRRSRKQLTRHRRSSNRNPRSRSRSRSWSRSRSRSESRTRVPRLTREDWEAEQARRELEQLRIAQAREKDERRLAKEYRDEAELQLAKRELDDIKKREARAEEEKRIRKEFEMKRLKEEEEAAEEKRRKEKEKEKIKKELEMKRLKEEEEAAEERRRRDKEAHEAVERYKQQEKDRVAREEKHKAETEKEYKRRLHEDLLKSGLDEKAISAILNNQKVPEPIESAPTERPTYTRMARKYLSIETLRTFRIEYDVDTDPEYVLIKRWVPEWEQDQFWRHTKYIREKRGKGLMVEEKRHHSREPEFEWVRKKHDRRRSKSPALLMYLAGGRPT